MRNTPNEKLDIIVNLSKLRDAEIRDENGMTKLVIPISSAGLTLSNAGNINVKLLAIPYADSKYGATHLIKMYKPEDRVVNKRNRDIIGAVYIHGKHDYDIAVATAKKAERNAKEKKKERENKFKGLEF